MYECKDCINEKNDEDDEKKHKKRQEFLERFWNIKRIVAI